MTDMFSPDHLELVLDATWKSFWFKSDLQAFLAQQPISPNFFATWGEGETKVAFLRRLFTELIKTQDGRNALNSINDLISRQASFPKLMNTEDAANKIRKAEAAVALLRQYNEKLAVDKQAIAKSNQAKQHYSQQLNKFQNKNAQLSEIMTRLTCLSSKAGQQSTGYEFQDWFYDLVAFFDIDHRRPYMAQGRQIDGSVTILGTTYLVELKFTTRPTGSEDIDGLRVKVDNGADNTMGILVSMAGFTENAIKGASGRRTTLLLLDATHIMMALNQIMDFKSVIERVSRHAAQTGESYLAVNKF